MVHWYSKVTIILKKNKNTKETIIVRRREYCIRFFVVVVTNQKVTTRLKHDKKRPNSNSNSYCCLRNDICTTTLWQPFDNFLSHTRIILLFSLFLFLSHLFLTNEKRGKKKLSHKLSKKSCSDITTLSLFWSHSLSPPPNVTAVGVFNSRRRRIRRQNKRSPRLTSSSHYFFPSYQRRRHH